MSQALVNQGADVGVLLAKPRHECLVVRVASHPEHVVVHQNLAGRVATCANTDSGNGESFGDLLRDEGRDALEDEGEASSTLKG